jgi:sugar phosphate isomerase/epimerase
VSRRDFIRLGAAGAAVAVAGCQLTYITDPSAETSGGATKPVARVEGPPRLSTRLGIQSYSFRSFKFEEAIFRCGKLGIEEIEPYPGHFPANSKPEHIAKIQALLNKHKVTMNGYGVCGIKTDEKAVRPVFEFCKKVGIPAVSIGPDPKAFDLLDKLCAEYDIKVGIHNHGPGDKNWGKLAQMLAGIKDRHPHIGVWLDTGHLERAGDDPLEAIRAIGPRLHGLHLKDTADGHDKILGTGKTDLLACVQALREVRFTGAFNLEYEMDAGNPDPGIEKSVACVRALIAKVNQS